MSSGDSVPTVGELLNLEGSTALVTGASGNIGGGIALRLAEAGASVLAHCRDDLASLSALCAAIEARGGHCRPVAADLRDPAATEAMFATAAEGPVRLIVNNAALQTSRPFMQLSLDDWRQMMATNLDAAFLVTQLAASAMASHGVGGCVVNVSSIEGQDPAVGHAHYSTSKSGLAMLTKAAAAELGPMGIRVNAVSPGVIDRPGLIDDWPSGVQRWHDKAPLGRMGRAEDVADAVLFLLSPAARWISGANLVVDGAMSAVSRW